MVSNKKLLSVQNKKRSNVSTASMPETADEYLEAGVHLEESGEKWRAGDAAKSLRFFTSAIETYDSGLRAFPWSFDLAYNKARLQYAVTQQPRFLKRLPHNLADSLRVAAESHLYALQLEQENADVLFNLAQLYFSLAESVLDDRQDMGAKYDEAAELLQLCLANFERCLKMQEEKYSQAQQLNGQEVALPLDGSTPSLCTSSNEAKLIPLSALGEVVEEEVWASIIDPVTAETLLETSLAQLEALKTLCNIVSREDTDMLSRVEQSYHDLARKIDLYSKGPDSGTDAVLGKATFLSAYANARHRLLQTSLTDFENEFEAAVSGLRLLTDRNEDVRPLLAIADARIDINTTLEERCTSIGQVDVDQLIETLNRVRWKHISKALDEYTTVSKMPGVPGLARIHIKRGDCELLRIQLGMGPFGYGPSLKSQDILIRNALIFYRAAQKAASSNTVPDGDGAESAEADSKIVLAASLQSRGLSSEELQAGIDRALAD